MKKVLSFVLCALVACMAMFVAVPVADASPVDLGPPIPFMSLEDSDTVDVPRDVMFLVAFHLSDKAASSAIANAPPGTRIRTSLDVIKRHRKLFLRHCIPTRSAAEFNIAMYLYHLRE